PKKARLSWILVLILEWSFPNSLFKICEIGGICGSNFGIWAKERFDHDLHHRASSNLMFLWPQSAHFSRCRAILYASGELKFIAISGMLTLSTSFISMGEGRVYAEHSRI